MSDKFAKRKGEFLCLDIRAHAQRVGREVSGSSLRNYFDYSSYGPDFCPGFAEAWTRARVYPSIQSLARPYR